ncbi:MAG: zinc ribbon domain-containing protein [Chloroflexi bacterium]|nr:zinc ribbon domain-containing protein [Chloroflexota bacterium]
MIERSHLISMNGFPNLKRFSTREWFFLIVCLVLILAFLPGGPIGAGLSRVQSTLYGLIPLALIAGGAYAFYRWWQTQEAGASEETSTRSRVCMSCNHEVAEAWRACPNCGQDLTLQRVFCRFCTYPMRSDWRLCPSCTRPVAATSTGPTTA